MRTKRFIYKAFCLNIHFVWHCKIFRETKCTSPYHVKGFGIVMGYGCGRLKKKLVKKDCHFHFDKTIFSIAHWKLLHNRIFLKCMNYGSGTFLKFERDQNSILRLPSSVTLWNPQFIVWIEANRMKRALKEISLEIFCWCFSYCYYLLQATE